MKGEFEMNKLKKAQYIKSMLLIFKIAFVVMFFVGSTFTENFVIKNYRNFTTRYESFDYSYAEVMCSDMDESYELDSDLFQKYYFDINNQNMGTSMITSSCNRTNYDIGLISGVCYPISLIAMLLSVIFSVLSLARFEKFKFQKWYNAFTVAFIFMAYAGFLIAGIYHSGIYESKRFYYRESGTTILTYSSNFELAPLFYVEAVVGFIIIALELYMLIFQMKNKQPKTEKAAKSVVPQVIGLQTEEFVKLKELLDSGIITQEEFAAKKKQLLGL